MLTFENLEKVFAALESGRCDAMVTDRSALASWRSNAPKPDDYVILKETLAKSPWFLVFRLFSRKIWAKIVSFFGRFSVLFVSYSPVLCVLSFGFPAFFFFFFFFFFCLFFFFN